VSNHVYEVGKRALLGAAEAEDKAEARMWYDMHTHRSRVGRHAHAVARVSDSGDVMRAEHTDVPVFTGTLAEAQTRWVQQCETMLALGGDEALEDLSGASWAVTEPGHDVVFDADTAGVPEAPTPWDNRDRPGAAHYAGLVQPIDLIDAYGLGFYEGTIIKYVARHRRKGGLEDLRKAAWYLERLIDRLAGVGVDVNEPEQVDR